MKLAQSDILKTGKEIKCEQQTMKVNEKLVNMYWYQNESNTTEESTLTNFFLRVHKCWAVIT